MSLMRHSISTVIFISIAFVSFSQVALADAFSWIDHEGNKVYGSKPPANAQNIETFKTKALSRYSSDKVLGHLGWKDTPKELGINDDLNETTIDETDTKNIETEELATKKVVAKETEKAIQSSTSQESGFKEITKKTMRANLEHGAVLVKKEKIDKGFKIQKCEVSLRNRGDQDANDLSVSFAFPDGSFIPASGDSNLKAGQSTVFKINEDLLPLEIAVDEDSKISPKVLVNGASL